MARTICEAGLPLASIGFDSGSRARLSGQPLCSPCALLLLHVPNALAHAAEILLGGRGLKDRTVATATLLCRAIDGRNGRLCLTFHLIAQAILRLGAISDENAKMTALETLSTELNGLLLFGRGERASFDEKQIAVTRTSKSFRVLARGYAAVGYLVAIENEHN